MLEMRQEHREVRLPPSLAPDRLRERPGAGDLGAEVDRNATRLVVIPPSDPEQARLDRVVVEGLAPVVEVVEEATDLV